MANKSVKKALVAIGRVEANLRKALSTVEKELVNLNDLKKVLEQAQAEQAAAPKKEKAPKESKPSRQSKAEKANAGSTKRGDKKDKKSK